MVLSRRILVNNESTSKLPITRELSCSTISFAKQKVSLTVNSLDVMKFILGTNTYKQCQKGLLLTEIDMKRSHLLVLQKEFVLFF